MANETFIWKNTKSHFKISFPRENEDLKHDLVEFKVQCRKVFVAMATNLPPCLSFQFLEQLVTFLVNINLLK